MRAALVMHRRLYLRAGRWQLEAGVPWLPFTVRVLGRPDARPGWRLLGEWLVLVHYPPTPDDRKATK